MSAALIPANLVPVARTDADWAFDIDFQGEDWTGSEVSVWLGRQGLPAVRFEAPEIIPTSDMACAIRIPEAIWATKEQGTYTVEVRKIDGDAIDDAAVFKVMLYRGVSVEGTVAPPAGDGVATGGVIVSRVGHVTVVRSGGIMGPPGTGDAAQTAFNDALTMLGVDNVQDAIVALYALIGSGPLPDPGGNLLMEDSSNLLLESGSLILLE